MDEQSVDFSERRYNEIVNTIASSLKIIGYTASTITYLPISAWKGHNLT
jgi:translation elongation factor EF-1alpha